MTQQEVACGRMGNKGGEGRGGGGSIEKAGEREDAGMCGKTQTGKGNSGKLRTCFGQ